jgi:hypothetical protein
MKARILVSRGSAKEYAVGQLPIAKGFVRGIVGCRKLWYPPLRQILSQESVRALDP